jgi:hypothetical protein
MEGGHDRKSTNAAMAPETVPAEVGIIVGRGSGSVYGTRRRGGRIAFALVCSWCAALRDQS